jgi:phosphoglycerate dehydrogenase-like enzyme
LAPTLRAVHVEPLAPWLSELYESLLADSEQRIEWAGDASGTDLRDRVAGAEALVTRRRRVDRSLIASAGPSLRFVQVEGRAPWAVDLTAARTATVQVSVLPHTGAIAVAEHTMALMLGVMRRLASGHAGTVAGDYRSRGLEPALTTERSYAFRWLGLERIEILHGKTLGLVGLGGIGLEVARRARAFDMEVLYYARTRLPVEYARLAGVSYVDLDELMSRADVVSLHLPHTEHTEGMIDAGRLARMRPSAIVVNTARGGLFDQDALVQALSDRSIAGAGLDVFTEEPLPVDHPLTKLDNVLLSPHVAGAGGTGQKGMATRVIENLARVARGEVPLGLTSPDGSSAPA